MTPAAYICHVVPGRVRVKIPSKRGDVAYFALLRNVLSCYAGVDGLQVNHRTGSVLLAHPGVALEQIRQFAIESGLFSIEDIRYTPKAAWERVASGVGVLDSRLKRVSSGEIDLRSVMFFGLVAMGIRQLSQGQIMAPAVTLLWYAFQLLSASRGGQGEGE